MTSMLNRALAVAAIAACGAAVAACVSQGAAANSPTTGATRTIVTVPQGSPPPMSSTAPTPSAAGLPTGPGTARTATAGTTDNGHTIALAVGDHLEVRLAGTGWTFSADTPGSPLRAVGQPTASVLPTGGAGSTVDRSACVPGGQCVEVTATYAATAPGTAVVAAGRTSCGEAMRCTGRAGSYRLTVIVAKAP